MLWNEVRMGGVGWFMLKLLMRDVRLVVARTKLGT